MGEDRMKEEFDRAADNVTHWDGRNPAHCGDVYRKGLERAARYLEEVKGPGISERRKHAAAIRALKE